MINVQKSYRVADLQKEAFQDREVEELESRFEMALICCESDGQGGCICIGYEKEF